MTPPKKANKPAPPAAPTWMSPPPEKGIHARIKEARERPENGLSIEALSRMSKLVDPANQGISHQTLVKYEKGIVLPGSRELRILCGALDVSADWLLMGRERPGYISMDLAANTLKDLILERIATDTGGADALDYIMGSRARQLAEAKEPKPRK